MRFLITMISIIFWEMFVSNIYAADFIITEPLSEQPMNLALQKSPIRDTNDEPCALVIISTDITNLMVYSAMNPVKVIYKTGEVWVYLSAGDNFLKFEKTIYANYRYALPLTLQNNMVYTMRLSTKAVAYTSADLELVTLTITINETDVYISKDIGAPILNKDNTAIFKLPQGKHAFRFTKSGFVDETQKISITEDKAVNVDMKPGATTTKNKLPGYITITSEPSRADVYINDQKLGVTPFHTDLTAGEHNLRLQKPMYESYTGSFALNEKESKEIPDVVLKPMFGHYSDAPNTSSVVIYQENSDQEDIIKNPPNLIATVSFSEPSKNNYLDALETGKLTLIVKNDGLGAGKGITIKLSPTQIKGLNYLNSIISEVPAGKTVSIDIPIEACIDVAEATHTLTISFEEQNGFPPNPCELQFSTKSYQKPIMAVSDVGIEDSNANGKIESGEIVNLTIRVVNQGVGDACGAYAKFYTGENVFLTEKYSKTQALGDLKPNQTKDVNLEFFVNDRTVNEIPLYVDFTEATGLATVNKLRVPISKTEIARPISRTVVTGIESDNAKSNEPDLNIDIEKTIPSALSSKSDTYAVVLGLETYSSSIPMVRFAGRDATWFKEYASQTLGIPLSNIYFRTNDQITKNEFDKVFGIGGWLDKRITAGKSEVIFYYAGHGVPAKDNKAYLVPYDGDPNYATLTCYPVEQIYNSLNRMQLKHSLVILDACFTGMNRDNQPLFADARPIYIKTELPSGFANLSILAGAASDQMSNAYPEKKHGLFSYFLMKGMQGSADTNQDKKLTLQELGEYVKTEVRRQAGFLDKEQTPELSTSVPDMVLIEY